MATKKEQRREQLQLLLGGWTDTMRRVVMKHVDDSRLCRNEHWSLDDFLDTKKELVDQALPKQEKELRKKLKRPTDIKDWDVTLICRILLNVCYPELKQQYNSLNSDVEQIRTIRNELSHTYNLEIEEVSYKTKSCQICQAISKGLTYINDTQYTTEMKNLMKEVIGQVDLDTMISKFKDWLEKDPIIKEIKDALPTDEYDIRPTLSRMGKTYHGTTIEPENKKTSAEEKYLSVEHYFRERSKRVKQRPKRDIKRHKQKLVELVEKSANIEAFIPQDEFKSEIKSRYPNLSSDVLLHTRYLRSDRRILFVAGDPDSGKKSFINLLLEAPILPVGKTTSPVGIIKIRKGDLSVIPQHDAPAKIKDTVDENQAAEFIRETLSGGVKTGIVSETEVFWPFKSELLQDDVEIIVESGLGGDTKAIEQHLPSSTAFIYVVDCGRAGGITTDRIRSIMTHQLDPSRVIFLLNKWDTISSSVDNIGSRREEEQYKWSESQNVIKCAWGNIKPEQIMKISVWQEIGRISPCIGIESDQTERARAIIYSLFDEGVDTIKMWLKTFSAFITVSIKNQYDSVRKSKTQLEIDMETYCTVHKKVIELSGNLKTDIHNCIEKRSDSLSQTIEDHIRSDEVRREMHNWRMSDFPCSLFNGPKKVKYETTTTVLKRLSNIVKNDMEDSFTTFTTSLKKDINSRVDAISNLLDELKSIQERIRNNASDSAEVHALDLTKFQNLTRRFDDILNDAFLQTIFNWRILYGIFVVIGLPLLFIDNLIRQWRFATPHTIIMQRTADDVIAGLNSGILKTAIIDQLKTCKAEVNELANNELPKMIGILSPKPELLEMGKEKYDSISKRVNEFQDRVHSFCTDCESL